MVDRVIEEKTAEKFAFFKDNSRFHFQMELVRDDVKHTFRMIRKHILAGHFAPISFEEQFRKQTDYMDFRGKIDRVDIAQGNERKLVKVVDYKSSGHSLDPASVYDGMQLQLPVYLKYAVSKYGAAPAAAFYMHVDDPIVKDTENPEKERTKQSIPSGLFAEDSDIVRCLDEGCVDSNGALTPGYSSEVIRGSVTKAGGWDRRVTRSISSDQMNIMCDYADYLSEVQAHNILDGDIMVYPYNGDCSYCGYKNFCRVNQGAFFGRPKKDGTPEAIFELMEDKITGCAEEQEGEHGDE